MCNISVFMIPHFMGSIYPFMLDISLRICAFAESCNTPYLPDGREGFEHGRLTFEIDEIGVVVQFGQKTTIDMKEPIARETADSEIDIRAIGPCSDRDRTEEIDFVTAFFPQYLDRLLEVFAVRPGRQEPFHPRCTLRQVYPLPYLPSRTGIAVTPESRS